MTHQAEHTAAGSVAPPVAAAPEGAAGVDSRAGWLVVAATFVSTFTSFGVVYSFGAFFRPMADEFGSERSATAFFFAITTFLYFGLGVFSGRLADRVGPRRVLAFGAVMMVAGLLATSRVHALWVGYITYGIGVGTAVACAYVPMVAAVGGWFDRYRTTAIGLSVAGIGAGTLVGVPVTERLIDAHGWRDTYVIMAGAAAVLYAIAAIGARRPPRSTTAPAPARLRDSIGHNRQFWLLYVSCLVVVLPLFTPFVFLSDYIKEKGISGSAGLAVGAIGLSSVVGRLGLGALASRFTPLGVYSGSFLVMALSFLLWFAAGQSYPVLLVFAVVLGVSYGGFVALAPAVAADLFGPVGLGGILGALYTAAGVGGLIGSPLMGALIDRFDYRPTLLICTALGLVSVAVLRLVKRAAP